MILIRSITESKVDNLGRSYSGIDRGDPYYQEHFPKTIRSTVSGTGTSGLELMAQQVLDGNPVVTFDKLMMDHFVPKLNQNCLFDSYEEASFFLQCHDAISTLEPGYNEYGEHGVLGIYRYRGGDSG